jgi:poly-gamma-glutamate synthesis protein (capsule biosynthesis protein)
MSGLSLQCVGDVYAAARSVERLRADPDAFAAAATILRRADVCFANLEAPLLQGGRAAFSTGVRLQSPPAVVEILRHLGLEAVSLANNHLMDFGTEGLRETLSTLRDHKIAFAGAGPELAAARAGIVLTAAGQRVGFLAACDDQGGAATPTRMGVAPIAVYPIIDSVQSLREQADYVVVALHTGIEFTQYPEPFLTRLARRLIDQGASVVVGHHPHVPQGIECYGKGLIAYSLGDFLFDLPRPAGDLDARQARFNACHPILEVQLADGQVAGHRVHWLTRDADGRYAPAGPAGDFDIEREFAELCRVLKDRPEWRRRVRAIYRSEVKDLLYYTPRRFAQAIIRGGPRQLRAFLWWLGTLRFQPKRRFLREGLAGLLPGGGSRWA